MPTKIIDIVAGIIKLIPVMISAIKSIIKNIKMAWVNRQRKKLNDAKSPASWSDFFKS
jgi:hypothetical protein